MILRDAFHGLTRFDQFQKSLGVAPNILTRRLNGLVAAGFLAREAYSERPLRYDYVLTEMGRDFRPVLLALMAFGNRHLASEGIASCLVEVDSGQPVEPVVVDAIGGRQLDEAGFKFAVGPAADHAVQARMAFADDARRRRGLDA
jgi:DNA-binding HxlR family transcriptional regulator